VGDDPAAGYQDLPRELASVDALLDDPVFFEPYRGHFSARWGRPSIPIETYLRMMFLKHRYGLGYETLCREVADSLSWSRFARVSLGTRVPHPSTLGKITARCGPGTIAKLNEALLAKAAAAKVVRIDKVRADKVRADTTVVTANVAYPTDSGLLTRAIALIVTLVGVIHAAGGAGRTRVRDRRRAAGRRAGRSRRTSSCATRRPRPGCWRSPPELADLAEATSTEAQKVLINARRGIARQAPGKPDRRGSRWPAGRRSRPVTSRRAAAGTPPPAAAGTAQPRDASGGPGPRTPPGRRPPPDSHRGRRDERLRG